MEVVHTTLTYDLDGRGLIVGSSGAAPAAAGGAAATTGGAAAEETKEEEKEEEKEESDEDVFPPPALKWRLTLFRWVSVYLTRVCCTVDCGWGVICKYITTSWVKSSIAF